jgi:hypothetical protein
MLKPVSGIVEGDTILRLGSPKQPAIQSRDCGEGGPFRPVLRVGIHRNIGLGDEGGVFQRIKEKAIPNHGKFRVADVFPVRGKVVHLQPFMPHISGDFYMQHGFNTAEMERG